MAQQALTSPVELTTGVNIIDVNYDGAGVVQPDMTDGVLNTFGSPLTVLYELNAILAAVNANLSAYLDPTYHVVIASADASFSVVWNDADFMNLMGFRDDLITDDTSYTATDTIGMTWIPPYYSADLGRLSDDTAIIGANAIDGSFSGIALAPGNYTRNFQWQGVVATNVYKAACEASFTYGATLYYPEEERCLEQFTINALTASPTGTEGISIKGAYYIEDLDDYVGAGNLPASMDGGGHRLRLSTSPDNYVFCHLKPARWSEPTYPIAPDNRLCDVGVELISSIGGVPTWSAP